jgi:putative pyruvate formate lyase activating enzyme
MTTVRHPIAALEHYLSVRDGKIPPRFFQARALPVASQDADWTEHDRAVRALHSKDTRYELDLPAGGSLLDLKIELADRVLDACDLCPHHCRVNRNQGETGFCGVAAEAAVHWEGILYAEEIELVPSHEIFLSGCTMRCAFCFSHEHITRPMSGSRMAPAEIAACISHRHTDGATNVNLVGGEPTVHIPTVLRALRDLDAPVPVVWNSNMYATEAAMKLLDGVVDLFLGDIHFGNPACAEKLGRIPEYLPSVQRAFRAASDSGASVIIRHLMMPGHVECCARPAMEWAVREHPDVPFHLMFQYVPDYRAVHDPTLGRTVSRREREDALRIAEELGVYLYRDESGAAYSPSRSANVGTGVGDEVDILVHDDGRVSFTRLIPAFVPLAMALSGKDRRLETRRVVLMGGQDNGQ